MGHKASPEKVGGTGHACARCTGQDRKQRLCVALRRIGKVDFTATEYLPITPSPRQTGYRNKMEFAFGLDGDQPALGLRQRDSHAIVAIEECALCALPVKTILAQTRQWMRDNAALIGALAMRESTGSTTIYNGSCCTGILQLNNRNIRRYAGVTRQEFATWSLDDQVNTWAALTRDAMRDRAPQTLMGMTTLDGHPVDAAMVLACVQLGIGDCQRVINAGSCGVFADINRTTICSMADRIRRDVGNGGSNGSGSGSGGTGTGSGSGSGGGTYTPPNFDCVRGPDGGCMSMNDAIRAGFLTGSGTDMSRVRSYVQMILVALTFLIVGHGMVGSFGQFSKGVISKAQMMEQMQRGAIIVCLVSAVMWAL